MVQQRGSQVILQVLEEVPPGNGATFSVPSHLTLADQSDHTNGGRSEFQPIYYGTVQTRDTTSYTVNFGGPDEVYMSTMLIANGPSSGNPFADPFAHTFETGGNTLTVPSFTPGGNKLVASRVWPRCRAGKW